MIAKMNKLNDQLTILGNLNITIFPWVESCKFRGDGIGILVKIIELELLVNYYTKIRK
jgi:hypothetical protein